MLFLKIYLAGFVVVFLIELFIYWADKDDITGANLVRSILPLALMSWFGFLCIVFAVVNVLLDMIEETDWWWAFTHKKLISWKRDGGQ